MAARVASSHGACGVLSLLFAFAAACAATGVDATPESDDGHLLKEQARGANGAHLRADDTVQDLLNHPAFAGFARLLLPWDDRTYDSRLPLRDLGTLLPYHSHVDTSLGARRVEPDDRRRARRHVRVLRRLHRADRRRRMRGRSNTGLFFFRGRPGAPFAVIAPGGGFSYVGSIHEGFPYAVAIRDRGYNAFVLKYRARIRRRAGDPRPGCGRLLHLPQCEEAGREHRGLFPVGQLGGCTDGGCDWFTRDRALRRR